MTFEVTSVITRKSSVPPILAFALACCLTGDAHAQYYNQYGSPQAPPSPQAPGSHPSGCYSGEVHPSYSCYSFTAPTGNWSCYSGCYTPPPHTPLPGTSGPEASKT